MAELSRMNQYAHLNRLRLLKWRDLTTGKNNARGSLAEMTDPRRDLVNIRAVPP